MFAARRGNRASRLTKTKTPADAAGIDELVRRINRALLAVLLDPRRAQAGKAVLIDRVLPGEEFLDGQRIAAARFFERKQSAANSGDDFGLAANDPTLRARRRQIGDRQGRTVRPDDVFDPRAMGFSHSEDSHKLLHNRLRPYARRLKICLSANGRLAGLCRGAHGVRLPLSALPSLRAVRVKCCMPLLSCRAAMLVIIEVTWLIWIALAAHRERRRTLRSG